MAVPSLSAATSGKPLLLAALRERIRRIEGLGGADGTAVVPLGVPELDAALPGGGLPLGSVHEVLGPEGDLDAGAVTAFAAVLLAKLAEGRGPVFWICRSPDLYAPGLAGFGLPPDRLVLVQAPGRGRRGEAEVLQTMEEALRAPQVGAVLAEVGRLDLSTSRRLHLAAQAGGVPGLLLRLRPQPMEASTAVTRWSVAALPHTALSGIDLPDGPPNGPVDRTFPPDLSHPVWRVELHRVRGGKPGIWHLSWLGSCLHGRPADMPAALDGPRSAASSGGSPDLRHAG